MCGNPLDSIFGGGGSNAAQSASQQSSNATSVSSTVSVSVPIAVDTTPLAAAINALKGSTDSQSLALSSALVGSSAVLGSALKAQGQAISQAVASSSGSNTEVQVLIAVIGLVGVLITAHVLKFRPLDL